MYACYKDTVILCLFNDTFITLLNDTIVAVKIMASFGNIC